MPDVGTSIFTVMSKLANEHGALNLSQGFPDFPIDPVLIDLVAKAMRDGKNQYAPMPGLPALKEQIAALIAQNYNREVNPDSEILVTAGGTQAIFSTVSAFIRPGDEVIMFDPSYDCYDPAVRLNGGIPIHIALAPPDFSVPWDLVSKQITSKTKAIIINTPHNPCGSVFKKPDLEKLTEIAARHNLLVFSDEVYEHIIFDGEAHQSVLRIPELASRSIAFYSFGKTIHATGWKVGYCVGAEGLMNEVRKAHQFTTFSVNTPLQWALAEYLQDPTPIQALKNFFQQKRDYFLKCMQGTKLKPLPCRGSYFQLLSYEGLFEEGDAELAIRFTKEIKLAAIPVSAFYQSKTDYKLLRFCFAKQNDTLEKAGEILTLI